MPKHDPLPWQHIAVEGGWDGVGDKDRRTICKLAPNNPENAKFIVRACNSHHELVEFLKEFLDFAEKPSSCFHAYISRRDSLKIKARSLIAKATGGE